VQKLAKHNDPVNRRRAIAGLPSELSVAYILRRWMSVCKSCHPNKRQYLPRATFATIWEFHLVSAFTALPGAAFLSPARMCSAQPSNYAQTPTEPHPFTRQQVLIIRLSNKFKSITTRRNSMSAHAGEKARESGTFHCASCSETVRVKKGDIIPPCPNGHKTYDRRTDETTGQNAA